MPIPFTQYLRPDGRTIPVNIERSLHIQTLADKFIAAGGYFECEELSTGDVSLTACQIIDREPEDVENEVCPNGPAVPAAVDRLVTRAAARVEK